MKDKLICSLALILIATACGGRSSARNAAQQNYETVEEGSASGVTSTIHGPGETLPPITGTNADTTTNFALNPDALPPTTPQAQPLPGTTFPPPQALPPPMTSASPSPAPRPRPVSPPPATDTTATPPPPPATTTTMPPEEPAEEEPPSPPADDTTGTPPAEEPPPPPPPAPMH